ncbi:tetratricopeptide repeat protein [Tabrizicola piscis]|uniref:Tetratricopeptide repeat protein n=1 Tax=Tabrizicola piscis TaxID=2494374 RepID=A0A3S8U2I1_9RHOB|nr:tetratricopeptide repeat protein [Tabrizicola piscis]AZL57824.1 tetratricopeptide repeat protein [Tabrizicola piscis]
MRCRPALFPLLALGLLAPALPALAQTCEDRSPDYAARITLCDQAYAEAETEDAAALALSLKGEAQRLSGDLDGAAETLAQALVHTPANAWVWVELGNVRYDQRDIAGALAHYSAALAVEDYGDAWANRAEAWWEFRMGQNCSDDADQALRLNPQYAYANEIKGRCLIDLGRAEEALSYFDTAISLAPGYQNAYRNKMAALADLDRFQDVVALADEALRPGTVPNSNPAIEEDILARRLLALAKYSPMNMVGAEAEALLRRYPQNLAAVNIKARALIADQKPQEADALTATLRANPDGLPMEAVYFDTLAQIDVALGRLDDAFANYEAALAKDPDLSKIYARKLSELGFLPLSNAPPGVLTALRRCMDVKKAACLIAS